MPYIGVKGTTYNVINPPIGKGGEGTVYGIKGMPNYVLKVFLENKRTETRRKKLLAMISTPLSDDAMEQVTWPVDVVTDNGAFIGYVMPFIKNNEPLNLIYSDSNCNLSKKITIAKNLCAAINAIHNAGQVCGDLNPNNIQVDSGNATITLVDADSYHISEKNGARIYRCEVGKPEFLAPEVQAKMVNGKDLITATLPTFTKESDLFALAVHIFALLMNGCHPFACAVDGRNNLLQLTSSQPSVTAPQPIENIKNGFYPFYHTKYNITTPAYAPDISYLPKEITDLFILTFVSGHSSPKMRPNCVDWHAALSKLQGMLKKCAVNKNHSYPNQNSSCPWCNATNKFNKKTTTAIAAASKNRNTTVGAHKKTSNTTTTTATATRSTRRSYSSSSDYINSSIIFWVITIIISLLIQGIAHYMYGEQLVAWSFGDGENDEWKKFLVNFASSIGSWGYVICGTISCIAYNIYAQSNGYYYGFKAYMYILSILCAIGGNILWLVLVYAVSIAIQLVLAAIIIFIVCSIFSGS